jgi:hypothetical protein
MVVREFGNNGSNPILPMMMAASMHVWTIDC